MLLLIKDIAIKLLVSGDKSARIVLETTRPEQITALKQLAELVEVDVDFKIDKDKLK